MLTPEEATEMLKNNEWCKFSDARELLMEAAATAATRQRKQDEALIRQMLDALVQSNATLWEEDDDPERPMQAAITAAKARLGES